MAAELVALILRLSLCLSAALLVVIALRLPVRRLAGARLAFWLWLLVPLVGLSALVPSPRPAVVDPLQVVRAIAPPPAAQPAAVRALFVDAKAAGRTRAPAAAPPRPETRLFSPPPAPSPDHDSIWLAAWAAGALALALRIAWLQARFVTGLGRLSPDPSLPGVYHADGGEGPAVVGLVRARIVLPPGFPSQYDAGEQALILAHERVHLRARHPLANALGAAMLCLQWFNPLAHLALRMMRLDQELACDATVIAAHPALRADYARAMLKTGAVHPSLPLACAWPALGRGALKRRIALLGAPTPRRARRLVLSALLALGLAGGALAAHGMGLRPSRAETSFLADLGLDYRAVDAQIASLTIPPRPPEPLITDLEVWGKRARDDQHQATQLRNQIGGLAPDFLHGLGDRRPMAPYMGRQAQYSLEKAIAARSAVVAAADLAGARSQSEQAAARRALQKAQDAYRAAQDKGFAVKLAQNHYLGDPMEWAFANGPIPDYANRPKLRTMAQTLLGQPRTAKVAQALIDAIDGADVAAARARTASEAARTTDAVMVGYEYEKLDRSILDRARDAWMPSYLARQEADLVSYAAFKRLEKAQLALAALDPAFPLSPKFKAEPGAAVLSATFVRQQALVVRILQQERGFILGRDHPDMGLVAQINATIARLRAVPNPEPGVADPKRTASTREARADWDRPYPNGSPYGEDPGIAFLEGQIGQRSARPNPDRAVIAALQSHLAQLKAGKAPI